MRKRYFACLFALLIFILWGNGCAESDLLNSESLNGRGRSDSGRTEPQYVGHSGYVAFFGSHSSSDDGCFNTPWMIPTLIPDKQFWIEGKAVEHKTEVRVLAQHLVHEGWGRYSGMLLVEESNTGEQLYIDVSNFITKPYWTYADLYEASLVGNYIAEYHPQSDYYPVNKNNEKVQLKEGTLVLVTGPTGTYGKKGPQRSTHPIEALVFQQWKYGYGGVSVYFAKEDLQITY